MTKKLTAEEKIRKIVDYCCAIKDSNTVVGNKTFFKIYYDAEPNKYNFTKLTSRTAGITVGITDIDIFMSMLRFLVNYMRAISKEEYTLTSVCCVIETEKNDEVIDVEELNDYEITFKGGVEI